MPQGEREAEREVPFLRSPRGPNSRHSSTFTRARMPLLPLELPTAVLPAGLPACRPACLPVSMPRSPPHHLPAIFSLHRLRKSPRALTADESNAPSRGTWSTVDHRTDVKPTISRRFADATDVPTQPPDTSAPWRPTTTQQ